MKIKIIFLICLYLVSLTSFAITNGEEDGNRHPYVGLAVFYDDLGNPMWRCTATLLSPKLVLTAGHCTSGTYSAAIWFESDVDATIPANGYPNGGGTSVSGTTYVHPQYNPAAFYQFDLGVIVLDETKEMEEYGTLPALGVLDSLKTRRGLQDTSVLAVGYGLQYIRPVFVKGERIRMQATLKVIDLLGLAGIPQGTSVSLSNNANTGGTCFGDSGGPIFQPDSNIIVAVTSYGLNGNCEGIGGGYRVDQSDDIDWITQTFAEYL